jgi:transferase CAF17, mitochondrial
MCCSGHALPLEYNIELLQGVTFDKGCYLGQELVARTHFQGLVRKRLLPVHLNPPCSAAHTEAYIGTDVFSPKRTRPVGTIRGVSGGHGIAHLRLQETWEVVKQKQTLYAEVDGVQVTVQPLVPDWWPGALKPPSLSNLFF